MMLQEMAKMIYGYIIKAELLFLRMYKIDPFALMNHMSLVDLSVYIDAIQKEEKKQHDSMSKAKIMECLKGINDYLNVMFYRK